MTGDQMSVASAAVIGDGKESAAGRSTAMHASAGTPSAGHDQWRRAAQAIVLALPSLVLVERAWSRRWMTDDGFINLRVARMILDGHGPVFNVGERVEATTSALWVWLIAAGDVVLPFRMEWVAVVLGIVGATGGLALATFGAARLHRARGATGVLLPVGALVVAGVAPFWDFATSGLEGGLTFGWLGLTGWLLCRWASSDQRLGRLAAAAIGLAPLVRPDLALALPLVLGGVLFAQWPHDTRRDRFRLVAAALAVPVAYQVFRMGYYASLVPNTALAKVSGRSRWDTGFAYLRDLVQPYWLVIPVVCLVAALAGPMAWRVWRNGDRRALVALTALPALGVVDGLYVVRLGGDYMHGRLLLPALFALVVPFAAVPMVGWPVQRSGPVRLTVAERVAGAACAVVMVWSVVSMVQLRTGSTPVVADLFSSDAHAGHVRSFGDHAVTTTDQGWGSGSARLVLGPDVAVYVDGPLDVTPPRGADRPMYAAYGIGVGGYALGDDVYVLDMLGLADPVVSRFEVEQPGFTGHEKPIPAPWLAARVATGPVDPARLRTPFLAVPLFESRPGQFDDDTAAARRALDCGELRDLDTSVHEAMTPGRFLANLVRAAPLTFLEVPADPTVAEDRYCN